ncbi:VOC family protein [Pseudofrankia asymbiotica]|uniref:VOC family protein n=1 Tax=Pseudofrankia asymbiotica TaxID=1834516 RepID=UPI0009D690D1|nr:VOC family protein [Pseudofrankia asymbiotica]
MTTLRPEDQFHAGVIVEDFEGTLKRLTELFGFEWCDELVNDVAVRIITPDGPVDTTITTRFSYSVNEPRLEVIRPIPGTVWVPADSGVHHLGYWSDDVPADSAALAAQGMPLEVAGIGPDGQPYWAYHRGADGPRIELVSRSIKPGLEQYWAHSRRPA